MSDTQNVRTTISLPEDLLFSLKKKALMERKTIKEIVTEGLSQFIGYTNNKNSGIKPSLSSLFGAWGSGESGLTFMKKVRYGKKDEARASHLAKLWKKSSSTRT
jgi:hypothetical protein